MLATYPEIPDFVPSHELSTGSAHISESAIREINANMKERIEKWREEKKSHKTNAQHAEPSFLKRLGDAFLKAFPPLLIIVVPTILGFFLFPKEAESSCA